MASTDDGIFASRSFRWYYAGQAASYLGDGLRTLAIPLLVFHITGSGLSLGITYALEYLPFALFSTIGGSFADRLDRRRLMIACDAVRFAIMALFAVLYVTGHLPLPLLYAGIVVLAICAAVFLGGQASSIPYLLGKDGAQPAMSALIGTEQGMNLIAPPIGGVLFTLTGPTAALAINAVTYLVSQLTLSAVKTFGPDAPGAFPKPREIADDIATGFRIAVADPTLRILTWLQLGINAFGLLGLSSVIPYFKKEYAASDQSVGVAFGFLAVGAIGGSVVAARTRFPFGAAFTIGLFCDGLVWLPVTWVHSLPLAVLLIALSNGCATFTAAMVISWRMRILDAAVVGRVFGVVRLIVLGGTVPGAIAGGYIVDHVGARAAVFTSATGFLILAAVIPAFPQVRHEKR